MQAPISCCLLTLAAMFLQVAVIEFARNVLGIKDADSTEFNPGTPNPAVVFMPEISTKHMGGTMRLGARRTVLQSVNCLTAKLYQKERFVDERHRHRSAAMGTVVRDCCFGAALGLQGLPCLCLDQYMAPQQQEAHKS